MATSPTLPRLILGATSLVLEIEALRRLGAANTPGPGVRCGSVRSGTPTLADASRRGEDCPFLKARAGCPGLEAKRGGESVTPRAGPPGSQALSTSLAAPRAAPHGGARSAPPLCARS